LSLIALSFCFSFLCSCFLILLFLFQYIMSRLSVTVFLPFSSVSLQVWYFLLRHSFSLCLFHLLIFVLFHIDILLYIFALPQNVFIYPSVFSSGFPLCFFIFYLVRIMPSGLFPFRINSEIMNLKDSR
jgi:hypothetical protein